MKFRLRNIIASFAFALICAGSIGGSLYNRNSIKEAKADSVSSETIRFILNIGSINWTDSNASIQLWYSGANSSMGYKIATHFGSGSLWYVDVPASSFSSSKGFGFRRVNPTYATTHNFDYNKVWNQGSWNNYGTSDLMTYNLCSLTDWNSSSWTFYDDFKISGGHNNDWANDPFSYNLSVSLGESTSTNDYEIIQYVAKNVKLKKNDQFKLFGDIKDSSSSYEGNYSNLENTNTGFLSGSASSNIKVTADVSVDIYFKPFIHKFYITENVTNSALSFASDFKSATSTICSTDSESADHSTALSGIWSTWTTNFSNLTAAAKSEFNTNDTDETIIDARARYVHIVTRYTSLTLWTGGPTISRSSGANRSISAFTDNSYALLATTILALVISASIGSYLLLKKKKVQ